MRAFAQKPKATQQITSAKSTVPNRTPFGQSRDIHFILHLQRTIGNQAVQRLLQATPDGLEAVSDATAPGRFDHGFSRTPVRAKADCASEQVIRMSESQLQRACACGGGCPNCQKHDLGRIVTSSGHPLDHQTRGFMESLFGHDLSHVRVHTDSRAAESAQAVNALAYTVGQNVVFGAEQFSPQSIEGKRLLAHELAHVVQQTTAKTSSFLLQRAPDEKRKRRDVVVVGEGWEGGEELARVLARGGLIIRVKSMGEAVAALAKIDFPIGTLYFVTHSSPDGSLKFGSTEGYIAPVEIADKLKSAVSAENAPKGVNFRGCSVGATPKAMNRIREALGARSVVAGDCFAVIKPSKPIRIGGKSITKASDVTDANRPQFEKLMKGTAAKFGAAEKCILNRSEKDFFAAGGRFVSLFFNPGATGNWIPGKSVCYKSLAPQIVDPDKALSVSEHCRLIKVEAEEAIKQHGEQPGGAIEHWEGGRGVPAL